MLDVTWWLGIASFGWLACRVFFRKKNWFEFTVNGAPYFVVPCAFITRHGMPILYRMHSFRISFGRNDFFSVEAIAGLNANNFRFYGILEFQRDTNTQNCAGWNKRFEVVFDDVMLLHENWRHRQNKKRKGKATTGKIKRPDQKKLKKLARKIFEWHWAEKKRQEHERKKFKLIQFILVFTIYT